MAEEKVDRISLLPDCLLLEIISRIKVIIEDPFFCREYHEERMMTTKEVIKTTAIISKRWQHLWTKLPNLIFIYEYDALPHGYDSNDLAHGYGDADGTHTSGDADVTHGPGDDGVTHRYDDADYIKYHSFISKTLTQCPTDVNLNKFQIHLYSYSKVYSQLIRSQANSWISNVISRNVQQVDFMLHDCVKGNFSYDDELFFNNSCFRSMKISHCQFNPPGAIRWDKLKCLCIDYGELDDDSIGKILSGSHCLETLELGDCRGVSRIDITSKRFKNLVLADYGIRFPSEENYIDTLKINAPYMLSLTIKGKMYLEELLLLDVSSLVKADLNFLGSNHFAGEVLGRDRYDIEEELLRGLLLSLGHVNEITLGNDNCLEALYRLEATGFQFRKGSDLISCANFFDSYRVFSLSHK
ncbi:hypothetical protein Tco_1315917 [Tanacetum coccineum]